MTRAWWIVLLVVACGDAKLEYKVKSNTKTSRGPASWDDMRDIGARLEVVGLPEGSYLAAIKHEARPEAEAAKGTIKIAGNVPSDSSGTFKTTVSLDVTWWALPETVHGTDELAITIEHAKQSPAALGRAVGTIIAKHLAEMRPKRAAIPVPHLSPATSVAVGKQIACSLHADKTVRCWGSQLADVIGPVPSKSPIEGAVAIAAGDRSVCAIREAGDVQCVGRHGQENQGKSSGKAHGVCGITGKVTKLAVGVTRACAIADGGTVYCWDTDAPSAVSCKPAGQHDAKAIPGITGATAIAVGFGGACALVGGGKISCWKEALAGRAPEVRVLALPPATDVLVGFDPCVVEASGQITCDRAKDKGETLVTAKVPTGSKVMLEPMYGCAIGSDAALSCWGVIPEAFEQGAAQATKEPKPILGDVVAASISIFGLCAVTKDGAVHCAGESKYPTGLPGDAAKPTKVTIY